MCDVPLRHGNGRARYGTARGTWDGGSWDVGGGPGRNGRNAARMRADSLSLSLRLTSTAPERRNGRSGMSCTPAGSCAHVRGMRHVLAAANAAAAANALGLAWQMADGRWQMDGRVRPAIQRLSACVRRAVCSGRRRRAACGERRAASGNVATCGDGDGGATSARGHEGTIMHAFDAEIAQQSEASGRMEGMEGRNVGICPRWLRCQRPVGSGRVWASARLRVCALRAIWYLPRISVRPSTVPPAAGAMRLPPARLEAHCSLLTAH